MKIRYQHHMDTFFNSETYILCKQIPNQTIRYCRIYKQIYKVDGWWMLSGRP